MDIDSARTGVGADGTVTAPDLCNCGRLDVECVCARCPHCACRLLLTEAGPACDPCFDAQHPVCNVQRVDLALYIARDRRLFRGEGTLRNDDQPVAWSNERFVTHEQFVQA